MQSGKGAALGPDEHPVFAAVIRPHRSLGRSGFRITMALCCLVAGAAAIRFAALGFWPVSSFLALDVLALFVALTVSNRRGRSFEEICLTPFRLVLRKVTHRGASRQWEMNPLWTRLHREDHEEFGLQRLAIVSRGQRVDIARDLSPDERADFASAFGGALAQVKRGY